MEPEEVIAIIRPLCEKLATTFRLGLKEAIDAQGVQLCASNGRPLKEASVTQIRQFIEEVAATCNNTVPVSGAPDGTFRIDLSYLFVSDCLILSAYNRVGTVSPMEISFEGCVLQHGADLSNIENLYGNTSFDFVRFVGKFTSKGLTFSMGKSSFRNASFESDADFTATRFIGGGTLSNTTFAKTANFSKAQFNADSDFDSAKFAGKVNFNGAQFQIIDFSNARFSDEADFSSARFQNRTRFINTHFEKPPWLHEATLHQDTSLNKATFHSFNTEEDWRAYRTLKLFMGGFRATDEEGRFFCYEQRTRCTLTLKENWLSVTGNLSKLYDMISEYGTNIGRPLVWLALVTIYFTLWFFLLGGTVARSEAGSWVTQINPAIGLALQNLINPFGIFNRLATFVVLDPRVAALSILQSLLSLSIVALLLLAIRRRFHKGGGQ